MGCSVAMRRAMLATWGRTAAARPPTRACGDACAGATSGGCSGRSRRSRVVVAWPRLASPLPVAPGDAVVPVATRCRRARAERRRRAPRWRRRAPGAGAGAAAARARSRRRGGGAPAARAAASGAAPAAPRRRRDAAPCAAAAAAPAAPAPATPPAPAPPPAPRRRSRRARVRIRALTRAGERQHPHRGGGPAFGRRARAATSLRRHPSANVVGVGRIATDPASSMPVLTFARAAASAAQPSAATAPRLLADVGDLLVDPVARIARRDDLLEPRGPPRALSADIVSAA